MSLVSIMMPCYNAEPYLKETLESLQHGCTLWELVVVNDQSTDKSLEVLRQYCPQAKVLQGERQGIGRALNLALAAAEGDYFAWIDADDLWCPGKLDLQGEALLHNPTWDGCFVAVQQFFHEAVDAEPPAASGRHRGALLIKREAFEKVGPFREDIKIGEFVDWCSRAQDMGLYLGLLPEKMYRRRIHQSNTMKSQDTDKRDYLRVLKAALDRKRERDCQPGSPS